MPQIALSSSDMVFHYTVATAEDYATPDPQKQTLLMLHPGLCDLHCKLTSPNALFQGIQHLDRLRRSISGPTPAS